MNTCVRTRRASAQSASVSTGRTRSGGAAARGLEVEVLTEPAGHEADDLEVGEDGDVVVLGQLQVDGEGAAAGPVAREVEHAAVRHPHHGVEFAVDDEDERGWAGEVAWRAAEELDPRLLHRHRAVAEGVDDRVSECLDAGEAPAVLPLEQRAHA